jgi:hypothetical protein
MARVKFLKDSVHPDYGYVKKGEVLAVPQEYLRDYEAAGIAEESDDDVSRKEPAGASQWEVHRSVVEARQRATREVHVGGEQPASRGTQSKR